MMEVYTGIANMVVLISVNLPLRCINLPFQIGTLSLTLSSNGCSVAFNNFDMNNGIPGYLSGKSTSWHGKKLVVMVVCSSEHRMGVI
jgi:hypothetical protein